MYLELIYTFGWLAAIMGMRASRRSFHLSDTHFFKMSSSDFYEEGVIRPEGVSLGRADEDLMLRLIRGGAAERKFLRELVIWARWRLPRYVWQEADTYKFMIRLSESSMDLLRKRPLDLADFQDGEEFPTVFLPKIEEINRYFDKMKKAETKKEKEHWFRLMKGNLPEAYLQEAVVCFNYETALNMLQQRRNHRLREWRLSEEDSICSWLMTLPMMERFSSFLFCDD